MSPFTLRPACPADEAGVAALCAQIWDGEDYVPTRFAEWVADTTGQFNMAFDGEKLVAFNKLTRLGPEEWWLEGLRVHPDYRGQGLARSLHDYAVGQAPAGGWLRFATSSHTGATHRLAASTGFSLVSRHLLATRLLQGPLPASAAPPPFTPVPPAELPGLCARLGHWPQFEAGHGLLEDGWKWYEIGPHLAEWRARGCLYWWRGGAGFVMAHLYQSGVLSLGLISTEEEEMPALLADLPQFAAGLGASAMRTKPVASPARQQQLAQAGWEVEDDVEMVVFQRRLG